MKTGMTALSALLLGTAAIATSAAPAKAAATAMALAGSTTPPVGHYELCIHIPEECSQRTSKDAPVQLTRKLWDRVVDINNRVNSAIVPRTDQEIWGEPEVWSYPTSVGDCEDFVLLKRRMLMDIGVPAGSVLITVVRQKNGDGHAVLTLRTDAGDFVLDNLHSYVLPWQETGYRFLKRQSNTNSGKWVSIDDNASRFVGSIRP